jgi:hypothetical protein
MKWLPADRTAWVSIAGGRVSLSACLTDLQREECDLEPNAHKVAQVEGGDWARHILQLGVPNLQQQQGAGMQGQASA